MPALTPTADPSALSPDTNTLGAATPAPQSGAMAGAGAGDANPLATLRGHFDKLGEIGGQLTAVRRELDSLMNLGEAVTSEDLVKSAANLVGDGIDAKALAALLSSAPGDGPGLARWIGERDVNIKQQEAMQNQLRSKLRMAMVMQSISTMRALGPPQQPPTQNPLAGAGGGANPLMAGGGSLNG